MDWKRDRRQVLKLFGGVLVTGGLAGCTSEQDNSSTETKTNSGAPAVNMSATSTSTATKTATDTATPTATDTATPTATDTATPTATNTPKQQKGKTVQFKSSDGRTVAGSLYGSGSCGVVFAPGVGYDRTDWGAQASAVAKAGHIALAVDLDFDNRPGNVDTLVGAATYLRQNHGVKTVVFAGASAGANAVVKANTVTETNPAGSVIIAPGRAVEYAPDLSGRLLFVVGKNDSQRFVQTTKMMHQSADNPKRLVTLPTGEHGQGIYGTNQGSKLTTLITDFVETVCSKS